MLQSKADAQDVVHALFVDLLQRGESNPDLALLYRAVTNRCLSFLRDERNRARLLSEHDETLRGPVRTREGDRVIDMDLLLKLTASLDETTLEVLVCRFFDDMTQEEAATFLGVSRKTIQNKLDRIREELEKLS